MATAAGCSSLAFRARTHSASRAARLHAETSIESALSDTLGAAISITIRAAAKRHSPTRYPPRVRATKAVRAVPPLRRLGLADRKPPTEPDRRRAAARTAVRDSAHL